MILPEHVTPVLVCPCCGYKMDRATGIGYDRPPAPGSVTVCMNCAEVLMFGADGTLRQPLLAEMLDWTSDTHRTLDQLLRALRVVKGKARAK